jgi:hypothetical protein
LLPSLESGFGRALALAGAIGGTVGLLYVIGGCVMWLRFQKVGLPADQAVALMPKVDLLVIGLRVMVLPALASGALLVLLLTTWARRRARIEKLRADKREKERQIGGEAAPHADELREQVQEIDQRLRREQQPPASLIKDALPSRKENPLRFWVLVLLALAAVLVVPFSPGALAWPIGMALVLGSWLHERGESIRRPARPFPVWRVAAVAVVAAAGISIARQTDRPVQLPVVQVTVSDLATIPPNVFADSLRKAAPPSRSATVTGVLVAMTTGELAVGDPTTQSIAAIPRKATSSIAVGPSVDRASPPRSLASHLIGGSAWAVTPLEFWCGNARYTWTHIDKLCKGRPVIGKADRSAVSAPGGVKGLAVTCPEDAPDVCRGYLLVTTKDAFPGTDRSVKAPLSMPPTWFSVTPDSTGEVKLSVDQAKLWAQVGPRGPLSQARVAVELRIAQDPAGKTVLYEGDGWVTVKRPAKPRAAGVPKHEKKQAGRPPEKAERPNSKPSTAGGGKSAAGGTAHPPQRQDEPTPTPTATAEPEDPLPTPTPDATSPLQQQEPSQQLPAATPTPAPAT